jgi:hypothetical protein
MNSNQIKWMKMNYTEKTFLAECFNIAGNDVGQRRSKISDDPWIPGNLTMESNYGIASQLLRLEYQISVKEPNLHNRWKKFNQ